MKERKILFLKDLTQPGKMKEELKVTQGSYDPNLLYIENTVFGPRGGKAMHSGMNITITQLDELYAAIKKNIQAETV